MTRGIVPALLAQAEKAGGQECCGLLLGTAQAGGGHVSAILPAANVHPHPARHFEVDPATLIGALRAARAGGAQVIGCYHSHPSGSAAPSATDDACAPRDGKLWAIVAGGHIGWWRDSPQGFLPLPSPAIEG